MTVGFVARVDSVMDLGAVAETITVFGASPLMEVTNTATSTELTRETLDILPVSRDGIKAFLGQVPGVGANLDAGVASLGDTVQFRVYGQAGEPWQMLEGVMMSTPGAGASGSHTDFFASYDAGGPKCYVSTR